MYKFMKKQKIIKYGLILLVLILLITLVMMINNRNNTKKDDKKPITEIKNPTVDNITKPITRDEALEVIKESFPKEKVSHNKEDDKFYYINVSDDRVYIVDKKTSATSLYSQKIKGTTAKN